MSARLKSASRGFTLIELMISVALLAVLLGIAVPNFQTWALNAQVRNAAESVANGLQRARAEAVARNTDVEFVLGTDSSWLVRVASDLTPIESRASSEGSKNVTIEALASDLATAATTITYNNLGGVKPAVNSLTRVNVSITGGTKVLRVQIGAGGNARMCDPSLATGSSPRAC